ncbi:MAG: glycosyltransferase [Endomicrobiia bacterium]|nr:glycosyltransferase [Endomicrobiia bacterium]
MKKNRSLILAFMAALTVRTLFAVVAPDRPANWDDAVSWRAVSVNLSHGRGFLEFDGAPTQQRPPVYPAFLAAIYLVFGGGIFWIKIFQAFASALIIPLVFYIARRSFDENTAEYTSWALAFYPPLVVYVGIVGSETLFILMLAASVALYCAARESKSVFLWASAGFSFAVCSMTRSTSIPLPPVIFAVEIVAAYFRGCSLSSLKKYALAQAVFFAVYAAALIPWSVRNYEAFGRFSPMASGGGGLFWAGTQSAFDGRAAEHTMEHYYDEMKGRSFAQQDSFALRLALQTIYSDPAGYARLSAKRFFRALFVPVGKNLAAEKSAPVAAFIQAAHSVWILAAVCGLILALTHFYRTIPATLVFLYFIVINTAMASIPRYRLPSEPFMMMFAVSSSLVLFAAVRAILRRPAVLRPGESLRVLVAVHDSVSPVRGGGALRTIKTASELKARGHDVLLVAPSDTDTAGGIGVERLPSVEKGKSGFFALAVFTLKFVRILAREIFAARPPVVFIHNAVLGFPAAVLRTFFNFRLIFDVTDLHVEYVRHTRRSLAETLALPFLLWSEYYTARRADAVIAVTGVMKNMLVAKGVSPAQISIVYDGVDADIFAPASVKSPLADKNIIHIGSLEETDGAMTFAEAIPAVADACPETKFIFVGGGGEFSSIVEKMRIRGLYKRCVFTGWVDYERVRDYMKDASIGVITRPLTPPNHTVITLKLLEYWAAGVAVVSTRLKGIEEVCEEGVDVIFCEPSGDDLARKLIALLRDTEKVKSLVRAGSAKSRRFEWPPLIKEIAGIVESTAYFV